MRDTLERAVQLFYFNYAELKHLLCLSHNLSVESGFSVVLISWTPYKKLEVCDMFYMNSSLSSIDGGD